MAKTDITHHETIIAIVSEFEKETDRAAVILMGSYLDLLLANLLYDNMVVKDRNANDLILDPMAPLGTFSSRIKASYCLGLISSDEFSDLNNIRKIRNKFAHNLHGMSFDSQDISAICNNLAISTVDGIPTRSRDKLTKSVVRIIMSINKRIKDLKQTEESDD